jgi:Ca2+-binding EF-hand superfamily protein
VSPDDWARADKTLAALDADQDEMIRPDEILARTSYPGSLGGLALVPPTTGTQQPRLLNELPVIALPADRKNAGWAHEWIARQSPSSEMKLASSGLFPSVAKALDRNADGKLDAEELLAWRETPADVSRQIRVGKNGAKLAVAGVKDSASDAALSVHGDVHLIVYFVPGRLPEEWAKAKEVALQRFEQADTNHDGFVDKTESTKINYAPLRDYFQIADRDGDGKISRAEWENFLRLRGDLIACQIQVTVLDSGPSLFEAIDADADGALSVRELRGAWQRLELLGCITAGRMDPSKLPRRIRFIVSMAPPTGLLRRVPREGPAWFLAMDRNNDGDVSRREFLGDDAAFRKLDADGDGLISRTEAERAKIP